VSNSPVIVNKRLAPRYIIFRDCWVAVDGEKVDVTLLNVSVSGLAFLGPETSVSVGDRVEVFVEGIAPSLTIEVRNVNYGRVGGKFEVEPDRASLWAEQFDQLIVGLSAME
jgi:PilZ domain